MSYAFSEQELEALEYVVGLWRKAGSPSSRQLAQLAHVSHTTVNDMLRKARFPAWTSLRSIVQALDGDPAVVQQIMSEDYFARGRRTHSTTERPVLMEILDELRQIRSLLEKHWCE